MCGHSMIMRLLREWTLPVAIATGTVAYLAFHFIPQLDAPGDRIGPLFDALLPMLLFLTLFTTFCKVDFRHVRPHRWHAGVLLAQLLLVAAIVGVVIAVQGHGGHKLLAEAVLTCVIGPSAAATPVVAGKLGGDIATMTTYTLLSALASALMIPLVFPLLEQTVHVDFLAAFLIILRKVALVLLLPLLLGWLVQHFAHTISQRIAAIPDLGFYLWSVTLSITTGITVKNIVHSEASTKLLTAIAAATLATCFVQFALGRAIGRRLGEEVNSGQALFQKNTALSIWVAYMYLQPVASIGAGCYVLWQNIVNSLEIHQEAHPKK